MTLESGCTCPRASPRAPCGDPITVVVVNHANAYSRRDHPQEMPPSSTGRTTIYGPARPTPGARGARLAVDPRRLRRLRRPPPSHVSSASSRRSAGHRARARGTRASFSPAPTPSSPCIARRTEPLVARVARRGPGPTHDHPFLNGPKSRGHEAVGPHRRTIAATSSALLAAPRSAWHRNALVVQSPPGHHRLGHRLPVMR